MAHSRADFRVVCALCLAGVGLGLVPQAVVLRWRAAVRDVLRPGQVAAQVTLETMNWAAVSLSDWSDKRTDRPDMRKVEAELASAEKRKRSLEVELAELHQRLRRDRDVSDHRNLTGETREPLLIPQIVEARILGSETAAIWRSRKLVAVGAASGIVESALVLEGDGPLLDQGQDARVSPGDAIYAGRCVIGKIIEVGRYSSSVQSITEAGYSGRARLARRTSRGLAFGSEGTLTGNGSPRCMLRHVAEAVTVGDEVYTGGTDGVLPYPMYYGRVVRAELESGATEWTIDVEPAATIDQFDRVQILRIAVNPGRILAD